VRNISSSSNLLVYPSPAWLGKSFLFAAMGILQQKQLRWFAGYPNVSAIAVELTRAREAGLKLVAMVLDDVRREQNTALKTFCFVHDYYVRPEPVLANRRLHP